MSVCQLLKTTEDLMTTKDGTMTGLLTDEEEMLISAFKTSVDELRRANPNSRFYGVMQDFMLGIVAFYVCLKLLMMFSHKMLELYKKWKELRTAAHNVLDVELGLGQL